MASSAYVTPLIGLCGVLLAFLLNAFWSAMRAEQQNRVQDAEYKAEVRAHMKTVEKRLAHLDDTITKAADFREHVTADLSDLTHRMETFYSRLDKLERRTEPRGSHDLYPNSSAPA